MEEHAKRCPECGFFLEPDGTCCMCPHLIVTDEEDYA